jgi:uncharacterized repeat protein (TIGR01451 family)
MKPAFLYLFALAFLLAGQPVSAQQWEPTNGPYGGGYAVYQNDTYVFASSANGIYRTTDGGLNWEKASSGLPEHLSTHLISVVGEHLLALQASQNYFLVPLIYISHDNGDSWTEVPLPTPATQLGYIAFDGQTITAQSSTNTNYATFQTSDEGLNWNMLTLPNGSNSFQPWIGASGDLLATNEDGLFLSQDNGLTWSNIPIPNTQPERIVQVQVVDSSIIIIPSYTAAQYTYVSYDYGTTWSIMYLGPFDVSKIIKYNGEWYCTWDGNLRKLEPGELTWELIYDAEFNNKRIGSIAMQNGVFLTAANRNVQRSLDEGHSFYPSVTGVSASEVFGMFLFDDKLYAGCQGGLFKVDTATWDWQNAEQLLDTAMYVTSIWVDSDKILAIVGGNRLLMSTDEGQSWNDILPSSIGTYIVQGFYTPPTLISRSDTIYLGGYTSNNLGSTWIKIEDLLLSGQSSGILVSDTSLFLYRQNGGVYRSDDGGLTWAQKIIGLPAPGWDGYLSIGLMHKSARNLFLTAYNGTIFGFYRSQNNGETWEVAGNGLAGCNNCQFLAEKTSFLEIGDYIVVNWFGQLYVSPDEGLNWIPYSTLDRTHNIAVYGNQLLAGTLGSGIYTCSIPSNMAYHIFKGKVYSDLNDNGVREPTEPWLPYHDVVLKETPQSATTDSLGYFEFYAQFISDTATVNVPSTSIYTNPPFHVFSEIDSIYEFGVRPNRYAEGYVYNDANNNGIRDAGEQGLQGIDIGFDNGYVLNVTDMDGHYLSSLLPAFDTIRAVAPNPLAVVHPEYRLLNIQDSIYNFGIYLSPDYPDLSLILNASNVPGPGFTEIYYLTVKNLGAETGANLVFNFDPSLIYLSTDYAPSAVSGNQIQWQLPSLQPLETFQISVYLQVPATVPINTLLNHNAFIEALTAIDAFPQNNVDSLTETVLGSFDPNDKQVQPQGDFSSLQIAASEPINYKIRFQNTGNFPAEKVVILDTLATGLDPATMRIEAASHAYEWNILDGHIVEFIFDMINLPDSTSNEADSHGFVEYSILCKDSMRLGGIIDNTAYIYFDFNEPVATNTTNTAIVRSSKIQTQTAAVCEGELYEGFPIFADTVFTEIVSYPYFDSVYLTMVAALPVYDLSVDTAVQIGTSFMGHPIGQDTTIMLNLLTADGCDSTMTYHVSVWTALNGVEKGKYQLKVFPTLFGDLINVQSPTPIVEEMKANLYGPLGQKVKNWVLKSGVSRWQLDGLNLPSGLYFLSINIGEINHVFKLVRQ